MATKSFPAAFQDVVAVAAQRHSETPRVLVVTSSAEPEIQAGLGDAGWKVESLLLRDKRDEYGLGNDPYLWPQWKDGSFDLVTCTADALESLDFPWLVMEQIARKLAPLGFACIIERSSGTDTSTLTHTLPPSAWSALARWTGWLTPTPVQPGQTSDNDRHLAVFVREIRPDDPPQRWDTPAEPLPSVRAVRNPNNPSQLPHGQTYHQASATLVAGAVGAASSPINAILELGCGTGETAVGIRARTEVRRYVGVECHESSAIIARQRLNEVHTVDIEQVSFDSLGFEEGSFDLLIVSEMLERWQNPWDVVADAARLVRTGGSLIIQAFNVQQSSILSSLVSGRWSYEPQSIDYRRLHYFTLEEIRTLCDGAGFTVTASDGCMAQPMDPSQLPETGNQVALENMTIDGLSREAVLRFFLDRLVILATKRP